MNPTFQTPHSGLAQLQAEISDLSHDGRGVAKVDGKVFFIAGALPGETVSFTPRKKRKGQFTGDLIEVLVASPDRVVPKCEYFGVCGGCTLQHLAADKQLQMKQGTLLDTLQKIGKVSPRQVLEPLDGPLWNYRRKARPGCKVVEKKGGVMVGFREQGSSYLTSLRHCETLEPALSAILDPLHDVISLLSCPNRIPQIEMAAADNGFALVLRHLDPLTESDLSTLVEFARNHSVHLLLQPGGLDSIHPLWPEVQEPLSFRLPDFDLEVQFAPSDFVQVNRQINEKMITMAVDALELQPDSQVLDLFCGLGNFTLPLATRSRQVVGVEGDNALVAKANANKERNASEHDFDHLRFEKMDLHNEKVVALAALPCNRMLLDPPRSGALDVVTQLVPLVMPEILVYVSCNPATLARDAEILVHQHGYRLESAGAINMFPHTGHVESMAKFVRA